MEAPGPGIRSLRITRFRSIELLDWRPATGLNMIVGPADSGKSTVLEAISLLFSTAPNSGVTEFDYFERDPSHGFAIEAVLAIGDERILRADGFPPPPLVGWLDGRRVDLPDEDGAEAVLVCRASGTADSELVYEIVGAGDDVRAPFSRALRARIGVARLGIADRGDRDLRLVQGGALDRFLQGHALRQSVLKSVLKTPIHERLAKEPQTALEQIEKTFVEKGLPSPIRLGLVGTPGVSLAASVGLTIGERDDTALPLTSWGTGTRRLAALEIAALGVSQGAIAVVDEPETGLEPYRQRLFIVDIQGTVARQAFVTTHAPTVIAEGLSNGGSLWRLNRLHSGPETDGEQLLRGDTATPLPSDPIESEPPSPSHYLSRLSSSEIVFMAKTQAEALIARMPVICEGVTEVGFATRLFLHQFGESYPGRGIFCVDAGGHDRSLPILNALIRAEFQVGAIVDDEGRKPGSWAAIGQRAALLRWDNGASLEKAVLSSLPDEDLTRIPEWAEEVTGREARHFCAEIRKALGESEKSKTIATLLAEAGRARFLEKTCELACPKPREGKKPRGWFKTFDGGYLLAEKLIGLDPKPELFEKIDAFLQSIEDATAA